MEAVGKEAIQELIDSIFIEQMQEQLTHELGVPVNLLNEATVAGNGQSRN